MAHQGIRLTTSFIGSIVLTANEPHYVKRLRPEPVIFKRVPLVTSVRYGIFGVAYLAVLLACAGTAILVVASFVSSTPAFLRTVLDHLTAAVVFFVATGGMGIFLARIDEKERHSVRCDQLLEHLLWMPNSQAKEQAVIELVKQMTSRAMFF